MAVFTFYMHEDAARTPTFEIAMFEDEGLAIAHGRKLLADRPRYAFVEVTRDDVSVGRVTREG